MIHWVICVDSALKFPAFSRSFFSDDESSSLDGAQGTIDPTRCPHCRVERVNRSLKVFSLHMLVFVDAVAIQLPDWPKLDGATYALLDGMRCSLTVCECLYGNHV
jgi:hypothetical protein